MLAEALSDMLHHRNDGELAPVSYYSHLFCSADRLCIPYKKECLAVFYGCEKCSTYLKHTGFNLHCNNLFPPSSLKSVNDVGHLERWILCLASFKFHVKISVVRKFGGGCLV
jgi:hypothetical protein